MQSVLLHVLPYRVALVLPSRNTGPVPQRPSKQTSSKVELGRKRERRSRVHTASNVFQPHRHFEAASFFTSNLDPYSHRARPSCSAPPFIRLDEVDDFPSYFSSSAARFVQFQLEIELNSGSVIVLARFRALNYRREPNVIVRRLGKSR